MPNPISHNIPRRYLIEVFGETALPGPEKASKGQSGAHDVVPAPFELCYPRVSRVLSHVMYRIMHIACPPPPPAPSPLMNDFDLKAIAFGNPYSGKLECLIELEKRKYCHLSLIPCIGSLEEIYLHHYNVNNRHVMCSVQSAQVFTSSHQVAALIIKCIGD